MQTIQDVIKPREIYWVEASDTVRQVARYMCERRIGAVAVKENDDVVGVFSERDLLRRVVNAGLNSDEVKVQEVMTTDLVSIRPTDEIRMAKALMFKNGVRHLLIISNDGQYNGMASMRDVHEAEMDEWSELIQKLNDSYYEEAYKSRWWIAGNRVVKEPYVP